MKSSFWDVAANYVQDALTPTHAKLGVKRDFPLKIFVYLLPEKAPVNPQIAQCIYSVATYEGNDSWRVRNYEDTVHTFGVETVPCGDAYDMTSRQLVLNFDRYLAAYPTQSSASLGSQKHYVDARAAIIDQFALLAPRAEQDIA